MGLTFGNINFLLEKRPIKIEKAPNKNWNTV